MLDPLGHVGFESERKPGRIPDRAEVVPPDEGIALGRGWGCKLLQRVERGLLVAVLGERLGDGVDCVVHFQEAVGGVVVDEQRHSPIRRPNREKSAGSVGS